jgi:hypothetical protein
MSNPMSVSLAKEGPHGFQVTGSQFNGLSIGSAGHFAMETLASSTAAPHLARPTHMKV